MFQKRFGFDFVWRHRIHQTSFDRPGSRNRNLLRNDRVHQRRESVTLGSRRKWANRFKQSLHYRIVFLQVQPTGFNMLSEKRHWDSNKRQFDELLTIANPRKMA